MKIEELKEKHPLYDENIDAWKFFELAYEGGMPFIKKCLQRHPRESTANWKERQKEGISFNYSTAIVDLFNFYLTEKSPTRTGGFEKDKLWDMFSKDCDLLGTNFDRYINECQKMASVSGSVGVLVNKPGGKILNKSQELKSKIYPYCAAYTLPNIYNWKFKVKEGSGRPYLSYLVLKEESANEYFVWYEDRWELWNAENDNPVMVKFGENPLEEVPFVWVPNVYSLKTPYLGISDIKEIAYITASIVRNISGGDEVINFAGFPMMRKPMKKEDGTGTAGGTSDESGVRAVLEFDPELPDSKPDWLDTAIGEPIEAILDWIDRKADEVYRLAHLSGVHGQRKSNNEVASGIALRYEFQQLNSVLLKKAQALNESEQKIIRLWLLWQKQKTDKIEVTRPKSFSVDDLAIELDNMITAMKTVPSELFKKRCQERIVKQTMPDLPDNDVKIIHEEISTAAPDKKPPPEED